MKRKIVLRTVASWTLIVLYSVALLKPIQPLIEYVVRYDLYSKVLCVNKDRPQLKCKGKCILMQRLKKAGLEDSQPFTPSTQHVNLRDYPIGFVSSIYVTGSWFLIKSLHNSIQPSSRWSSVFLEIFHPPS